MDSHCSHSGCGNCSYGRGGLLPQPVPLAEMACLLEEVGPGHDVHECVT